MTTFELLDHLNKKGIALWVQDGNLRYRAPNGALDADLKAEIANHKPELLTLLRDATLNDTQSSVQPTSEEQSRSSELDLQKEGETSQIQNYFTQLSTASTEKLVQPTSFAQQRLWFIDQFMADAGHAYNIPMALHIEGALDVAVLKQALDEIIRRHAALRTTFIAVDNEPRQVITPTLALDLPLTDLSDLPDSEKQTHITALLQEMGSDTFDLNQGPLLRTHLIRLTPKKHILSLIIHHIIADGWSINILQHELWTLYEAFSTGRPSPLPELPVQYADFAVWQRAWLQGDVLDKQLAYWRQQLGDNPPILELPTDYPHPPTQTYNGARYHLTLPTAIVEALKALSKKESVTLFMTLTAAFKTLLHRYTQQTDITIGTPIANRTQTETEPLIGFFVNTLALRTDLSGNPSFTELLKRVRHVALGAYAHQDIPFEKLVADLHRDRDMSRPPFFQTMFVLQNTPYPAIERQGLTTQLEGIHNGTTKFDLMLNLTEKAAGLTGFIEYNTDLYTEATIERMVGHLTMLLKGIITNPDTPLAQLPLLPRSERSQLLNWAGSHPDYPRETAIHRLFETQVEQTPQAPALIFEAAPMTYQDLNQRANQLAHHLQGLGLKAGDLVGLCLDRSPEMMIGVLAILKAGGAYVPLDPNYPKERLAFMLTDTQTPLLVTQQSLVDQLPEFEGHIVCLDTAATEIEAHSTANLTTAVAAQDLAYVMYTSGSTGQPKGVCVTHRNVVRLVKNTDYARLDADEVFLQFAPISFDAATLEIWGPLLNGGRLVIFPAQMPSLETLGEVIEQQQVTTLWLTAGLFHQMVDMHLDKLRGVRQLLAGGDVLSVPHVQKVLDELPDTRLINGYGPTENTTFTTCYPLPPDITLGASVPIGRPIANTQVYILDASMQPVPIGVPGELYAGGDGVARGYLNRPDLTAERFILDPFSDDFEARLYKTGDLARWLPDGTIEFLGRIDNQVKIRGFRIELSEIETLLSQHPAVENCVVIAREDTPGDKRLVAYVTSNQLSGDCYQPTDDRSLRTDYRLLIIDNGSLTTDLRQHLTRQLPDYMIPAAFVFLDELPLNPNGKVERRKLPAPTRSDVATEFVPPEGPIEEMLVEVWQEVLSLDQVGLYDNFFQLGGHSLLATKVVSRLHQEYDIDLPLRTIFESPTIYQLAVIIEKILIDELDEEGVLYDD